jgi:aminoglycoside 3-N-acetyltransferase
MATTIAWATQASLVADIQRLGVAPGDMLMVHSSVRAVGSVIGGPNTIIAALLAALTPAGTLMMYLGWEEAPTELRDLPAEAQQLFHAAYPPYDPRTSGAVREHGMLVERFRSWPGVLRSDHPDCSMGAWGAKAAWLTAEHPLRYGYGLGSPLHKLCAARGSVLMLGAPLDTITLLHYAEDRAQLPHKRVKRYTCPVLRDGQTVWVELEEYDTSDTVIAAEYEFDTIARDYLATGKGRSGVVGQAPAYVFPADDLAQFAIEWLEHRFGGAPLD